MRVSNVFSPTVNRILVYLLVYQCYMRRTGCDYVSVIVDMITHYYKSCKYKLLNINI